MDQPGIAGHWSIKDIVAHLTGWRRRTVARLQAAGRGDPEPMPPWPEHLQTDDQINAWIYETSHQRPVHEVLDHSQQVFEQLLAAMQSLPAEAFTEVERYLPWWRESPFIPAAFFAHFHEEHEPDMRAFLTRLKSQ
jgi:hypothetical protein